MLSKQINLMGEVAKTVASCLPPKINSSTKQQKGEGQQKTEPRNYSVDTSS